MSEIGSQIIDAVRIIAARNPLFVYHDNGGFCEYVRDGQPSCLIGRALWELGLIDATMEDIPQNCSGAKELLTDQLALQLDLDELHWLDLVQGCQDAKDPWSEAVSKADNFREEMLLDW